jgi:hypothetical protein
MGVVPNRTNRRPIKKPGFAEITGFLGHRKRMLDLLYRRPLGVGSKHGRAEK